MKLLDIAKIILEGNTLEDKLLSSDKVEDSCVNWDYQLPKTPGRVGKLQFSEKNFKFPTIPSLKQKEKRGMALHFFANHELLAIEMMAAAILVYPHKTPEDLQFKKGLYLTLKDEQKHLSMYRERMGELGIDFGDLPLNGFFWQKMSSLKTPSQFLAVMSLTFESANIDFSKYYCDLFWQLEDHETAKIMEIVYKDEIGHVALGQKWLNRWKSDMDLWEYYKTQLPLPLTPARAKGIQFDEEGRRKAGLDEGFVENLKSYRDSFRVTDRKSWKNDIS